MFLDHLELRVENKNNCLGKTVSKICEKMQYFVFPRWMLCCPVGYVERGGHSPVTVDLKGTVTPKSWCHWYMMKNGVYSKALKCPSKLIQTYPNKTKAM